MRSGLAVGLLDDVTVLVDAGHHIAAVERDLEGRPPPGASRALPRGERADRPVRLLVRRHEDRVREAATQLVDLDLVERDRSC